MAEKAEASYGFCSTKCKEQVAQERAALVTERKKSAVSQPAPFRPRGYVDEEGYVMIKIPGGWPSQRVNGYVLEHRYVMEKFLGRSLGSDEHVHHKDQNKWNNALENLLVVTNAQHTELHKNLPLPSPWKARVVAKQVPALDFSKLRKTLKAFRDSQNKL